MPAHKHLGVALLAVLCCSIFLIALPSMKQERRVFLVQEPHKSEHTKDLQMAKLQLEAVLDQANAVVYGDERHAERMQQMESFPEKKRSSGSSIQALRLQQAKEADASHEQVPPSFSNAPSLSFRAKPVHGKPEQGRSVQESHVRAPQASKTRRVINIAKGQDLTKFSITHGEEAANHALLDLLTPKRTPTAKETTAPKDAARREAGGNKASAVRIDAKDSKVRQPWIPVQAHVLASASAPKATTTVLRWPFVPGPSGRMQRVHPLQFVHEVECVPPRAFDKEADKCVEDPRSLKTPVFCEHHPEGEECTKYRAELNGKVNKYMKLLKESYPYKYKEEWYRPGDTHKLQPQRYPHKDMADLGDNYISGWGERSKGPGEFEDQLVSGHDLGSHTPSFLWPITSESDDWRGLHPKKLKPPIAEMEGRVGAFSDEIIPLKHYHDMLSENAKRARFVSRDRMKAAGDNEQGILKGWGDGRYDPFGFLGDLKDDHMPATEAWKHKKYLAYQRPLQQEPITDMAINGWNGQNGAPVHELPAAPGADTGAGAEGGEIEEGGQKFWRGKPLWCIKGCLGDDPQFEYELLDHPPTPEDLA